MTPYNAPAASPPGPPEDDDALKARSGDDEAYIRLALERFRLCADAENAVRLEMLRDIEFYNGEQWDKNIESRRALDQRPCLVINRLPQFVHQVTNEIRQNSPAPKVSPVDDLGDKETAEIIQGIYRHIQALSGADAVRSYAAFYQVVCGRGYYRLLTRRANPYTFDLDIVLERIKNPMTVYMDPTAQAADRHDAKWAFIIEDLTRDEFKARFPNSETASAEEFRSVGDGNEDWATQDSIRVAEYFTRELVPVEIAATADGSVYTLDKLPPGSQVIKAGTTQVPMVRWVKMNCYEILESQLWPGQWIPIIPVLGEEFDLDGKQKLVGMVRNAKDPQRMLNYWESAKTEMIALAPRVPYIVAEGQLENHEAEWQQANVRNWAYLTYKPRTVGQELAPPPQRQVYEPPVQAISVAEAAAIDHMKAATGIYDASLGNRSNETSGIAIRQRQSEGDIANYHFIDNLNIAITHEARCVIDLIPKIYDRPGRIVRIVGEDGNEQQVTMNAPFEENGMSKIYDLTVGHYDVVIDTGPSYKTKRQEAQDGMIKFAQVAAPLLPRFADLLVQAMDFPMADEIADRIRPPDVAAPGEAQPIPPQAAAMIQQLQQQNQMQAVQIGQMTEVLNSQVLGLQSKERMQTQKIESDERMKTMQTQADLVKTSAQIGSQDSIALLQADIAALNQRMRMLQMAQPVQATAEPTTPAHVAQAAAGARAGQAVMGTGPQAQAPPMAPPDQMGGGFE